MVFLTVAELKRLGLANQVSAVGFHRPFKAAKTPLTTVIREVVSAPQATVVIIENCC